MQTAELDRAIDHTLRFLPWPLNPHRPEDPHRMTLEGHAEVLKLALLLGVEPERFAYLEQLDPDDVRALRERATVRLYEGDRRLGGSRSPPASRRFR